MVFSSRKENIFYFILYVVSFLFAFTTQGIFWDDWVIFHVAPSSVMTIYAESGRPIFGIFFNTLFFLDPNGFYLSRFLLFICFLIPIYILKYLLSQVKELTPMSRFFIVCFFTLFPVNFARVLITILQYSFCFLLFFIAFGLTAKYLNKMNIFYRVISLGLFYLSFTLDSLILFHGLVLIYILYIELSRSPAKTTVFKFPLRYADYIGIPILYLVIKQLFYKPYGLYANYNAITLDGLKSALFSIPSAFRESFSVAIDKSFQFAGQNLIAVLLITLFLFVLLKQNFRSEPPSKSLKNTILFAALGLFCFALSVYPYLVVGRMPDSSLGWDSRHQILVPLGAAFVLYFTLDLVFKLLQLLTIKLIFKNHPAQNIKAHFLNGQIFILSLFIAVFASFTCISYLQYQKDWFKQLSMLEQFKTNQLIKEHTTFLFIDKTKGLNVAGRRYNFYEYTGIFKYAFGDETRFGSDEPDVNFEFVERAIPYHQYSISNYLIKKFEYNIEVTNGTYSLTNLNTVKLLFSKWFDNSQYENDIKNVVFIKIEPHI